MLNIGVAKKQINPKLSVPHAGWGAQTHVFATGIEADFYTTAMIINAGPEDTNGIADSEAVLIDVDAGLFVIEQSNLVREAVAAALGLSFGQIRLSVTHTHAGPCFWSDYYEEGKAANKEYFQFLLEQTVNAALEAKQNMKSVTMGAGVGACSIGKNRRQLLDNGKTITGYNENGIADPDVGVLRFEDEAGEVVATIVHYSCHPTTLGYPYKLHSPDYPGIMKKAVEQATGGICLFLQGSAGNIGPGPEGFLANLTATRRMGAALGAVAMKVSLDIEAASFEHRFEGVVESGASLGIWHTSKKQTQSSFHMITKKITLPLKKMLPLEEAQATYQALEQELGRLQSNHADEEEIRKIAFQMKRAFLAWDTSNKYNGMSHSDIEVQLMSIGDAALIGVPLEPFVEIGLSLKAKSPFRVTLFSGYANGHLGYLPIAEAYPQGGYEVETSPFLQGAAELFIEEVAAALVELHNL
ncbi:neutral/alkaline non-lysosomal ceramidase N-terminal domain-containing protein [Paenibacillus eucommiae]|uniref:Neutral/alkaline non-lysosomal ceramidase N-terminal domain-containing protein n=1 Tax=Paenibacillus eucommiae TaxID=1355755 RepID=A0ABS4IT87_9BACL|nr:neutral/alkaline non-lysosomal ceramidase N-terminal domain-containing protein [Paenibacillus eucommiae]MBP1990770.1 hypothetical protein [Paenibacillus eucommiae]